MSLQDRYNWVLGLCPGPHDASAALVRNGQLLVMAEQERFSRSKAAPSQLPHAAIAHCLRAAGIGLDDVSAVGIGLDVDAYLAWLQPTSAERDAFLRLDSPELLFPAETFTTDIAPAIYPVRHHIAHGASAFHASGFTESAVVVIDNRGEDCSAIIGHGTANGIEILATIPVEESLGLYYLTAAEYTGLGTANSASGKFMGLASYGVANQLVPLVTIDGWPSLRLPPTHGSTPSARRQCRVAQLKAFFKESCYPFEGGCSKEPMAYANFAASVQLSLEEAIVAVCKRAKELTGSRLLSIAGGVALNCTANGRLHRAGLFDDIFIPSAAHDAGTSLGAALEVSRELGHGPRTWRMEHANWGPEYSDEEVEAALQDAGLATERLDDNAMIETAADIIADHGVIGWFQGRAEIGPRALGARSVLANPARRSNLTHVNQIKGRENWRPLAPSVTEEDFSRYFVGAPSPFMLIASDVRPEVASNLPAIVHVDRTARPQAVGRKANPRFWRLLAEVGRRTGAPVVLNTSFNVAGEPIVNSPSEAIHDFLTMPLDALAIGNYVVRHPVERQRLT